MKEKISLIAILANVFLASGKVSIGLFSKSTAILAEGIHSGMDIFSSVVVFSGIKIAKKEADQKHPYGYYKYEALTGLIITTILFLTGAWIIYEAYQGFVMPEKVVLGYLSIGVMIFSAVINEIMARLKIHYGKKENSVSLISDGVHSRVDVYTSIAVLIGLMLTPYWIYADSFLAMLIGIYIIKESFSLGKETSDSLLDVSAGKEIEDKIKNITKEERIEISELKTQKRGSAVTANLEIRLSDKLPVGEAAKMSENLRKKLIERIESLVYVIIGIKSHNIESGYYKPMKTIPKLGFGQGFGWQRKAKFKDEVKEAQGRGPDGICVCVKCGYQQKHEKGMPCSKIKCLKCGIVLERQ